MKSQVERRAYWREYRREWRIKNRGNPKYQKTPETREKARLYAKTFRAKHPGVAAAYAKRRREQQPEQVFNNYVKYMYGITLQRYNEMLALQGGLCAICLKSEVRRKKDGKICHMHVDHDHATGGVRGLLCHRCNTLVGIIENREIRLEMIHKYLYKD